MSNMTTSTECPDCGLLAIRGTQEAGEHETETCECPNGHTWERRLPEQEGRPTETVTHHDVESHLRETMDWPQYYVVGEDVEDFTPAYYRVDGPNGPVSCMNPNSDPWPMTMYDFAMEAQSDSFRWCEVEETPWDEVSHDESDSAPARSLKRFENPAQLLRHIAETEDVDIDTLWDQYEDQLNDTEDT